MAALDRVFHALADPSRRAMVDRLTRVRPRSRCSRPFAMTLAAVVQHLKLLEDSGLVRSEKVGRVRTCRIEPAALTPAEQRITKRSAVGAPPRPAGRCALERNKK